MSRDDSVTTLSTTALDGMMNSEDLRRPVAILPDDLSKVLWHCLLKERWLACDVKQWVPIHWSSRSYRTSLGPWS